MKLITVVGARPQFIKAATVSRAIAEHNRKSPSTKTVERIIHTGQHYDDNMSKVFFDELAIPRPDYNLGVGSGSHGEQTGKMLERIEHVLINERPDCVLVYGDTNSTLAGALASAKIHISVAHVEAGLRSFNRRMPEETNRVTTDHLADLLFCPTKTAVTNLSNEGISTGVYLVGDVMYDCMLYFENKARSIEHRVLDRFALRPKEYYLATIHRAESTNDSKCLRGLLAALRAISKRERPVLLPLHPRTRKAITEAHLSLQDGIRFLPPVSYAEMLVLEKNARVILTDSGGVQKEAYWHQVPCVTLRDETEWVETVELGWNNLAGVCVDSILEIVKRIEEGCVPAKHEPVYGEGHAADLICAVLMKEHAGKAGDRS